jgi:hypothetical protein
LNLNFINTKNEPEGRFNQRYVQKVLIYLSFVVIATFFWFLVKLGSNFNAVIEYPINFTHIPEQKVIVNTIPTKLKLSVQATGFNILRYKINTPVSVLIIDMNRYSNQILRRNVKEYNLLTRNITEEIKNQLPTDIELVSIMPDSIPFIFSTIREKKIPVKPDLALRFARQTMLDGNIVFEPDSVTIHGPDLILDTLEAIYTQRTELTDLQKKVQKTIYLKTIEGITMNRSRVEMTIPVAKYTESSITVPIMSVNVADTMELIPIPNQVTIRYLVSLTNFNNVLETDFRAEIDAKDIANQLGQQLPVKLTVVSAYARELKIIPEQVNFVLEKKR